MDKAWTRSNNSRHQKGAYAYYFPPTHIHHTTNNILINSQPHCCRNMKIIKSSQFLWFEKHIGKHILYVGVSAKVHT